MSNWREALDSLEITTTSAAGPAGTDGEWHQLVAAFGTKGFLRALTNGEVLALECAPPGDLGAARHALEAAGWTLAGESAPFVASRAFPVDIDDLRANWVVVAKLADATRGEDAPGFLATLAVEDQPAEIEETAEDATSVATASSGGSFEAIGETSKPAMEGAFAFAVAVHDGQVDVSLGFSEVLARHQYDELERRLVGNLRGKYDVVVTIAGAHEVASKLDVEPITRVALRVRPDPASPDFTLSDAEQAVGRYFETLSELAASGIDPLVFLGARASKRETGAFEAIGSSPKNDVATITPTHTLLVADDDGPDDEEEDAVVFGGAAPLEADAPLESARYDDERLKRSDATTALVDVVLRHPGYSDRSMGQVMSILFSLDYSSCLEIAERAPTVVAWGVARDRALTMKTVIEGAGGKVVLVEPGTFGAD